MNAPVLNARITNEEFARMVERGLPAVLGRVELREGALYRMNAQHVPHGQAKRRIFESLRIALQTRPEFAVETEITVSFGGGFAPLPDVIVWRPVKTAGPIPGNTVSLIVEVADSTLADDLGLKLASYAAAGLPEYWVVNLGARVLHQYASPRDGGFTVAATHAEGSEVASVALPGARIIFHLPG
jgi:Uma2 family endonuclease